jgi:hypothetical protein
MLELCNVNVSQRDIPLPSLPLCDREIICMARPRYCIAFSFSLPSGAPRSRAAKPSPGDACASALIASCFSFFLPSAASEERSARASTALTHIKRELSREKVYAHLSTLFYTGLCKLFIVACKNARYGNCVISSMQTLHSGWLNG